MAVRAHLFLKLISTAVVCLHRDWLRTTSHGPDRENERRHGGRVLHSIVLEMPRTVPRAKIRAHPRVFVESLVFGPARRHRRCGSQVDDETPANREPERFDSDINGP